MITACSTVPETNNRRLWFLLSLVALTILGAAVRWSFINHPMRYDESYSFLRYGLQSPWHVATHYVPANHVFHNLLVTVSRHLFGTTPAAIRTPALVAGVALIPASAWMGWMLFSRYGLALFIAATVCGSSQLIEYSTNARGYSWLTLMATLLVGVTVRLANQPSQRRWWLGWAATASVGAYTIPIMVCPAVGLFLALIGKAILFERDREQRSALIKATIFSVGLCVAFTTLLYLPILIYQGPSEAIATARYPYAVWQHHIDTPTRMLGATLDVWLRDAGDAMSVVWILGGAAYLLAVWRHRSWSYFLPLLVLLGSVVVVTLLSAPFRPRAWMFAYPLYVACVMSGLVELALLWRTPWGRQLCGVTVGVAVIAASAQQLANVSDQPYLTSEPNVVVDVPSLVDAYEHAGSDRAAVLMRYTPAMRYYLLQRKLSPPKLPSDPSTDVVLITADRTRPLAEHWNDRVEGFDRYQPARPLRTLARCTLYIAEASPTASTAAVPRSKPMPQPESDDVTPG